VFERLEMLPADAILGLIAEHRQDPRENKIDLGVGVYRTETGNTPVLDVVKVAEQRLLEKQDSKAYIGTAGDTEFCLAMQRMTFANPELDDRLVTYQAPGGSGSLRVAAGVVLRAAPGATVWVSEPTWANHVPLLGGAGLELKSHPYYDTSRHVLDIDGMLSTLDAAAPGDLLLLHACCHNPSGLDPTEEDWRRIADLIVDKQLVPFIDMAYQGFATGVDEDAFIIRHLAERVPEMIVCNSCSKNFGLYRDRVGTVSLLAADKGSRDIVHSQASIVVRTLYSVPPDHGAAVVSIILNDDSLRANWLVELGEMRERLRSMRELLTDALSRHAPDADFSHLVRASGMFCFLGVSKEQVQRLKKEFGIYMVDSSRINVAGITEANVDYLASSIAAVL
jgi:aspartate aminotransferase